MPMGPGPFGIVPFAGVKFLGYSAAGLVLERAYPSPAAEPELLVLRERPRGPFLFGAVRTLLGIVAGASYAGAWYLAGAQPTLPAWLLLLLPVRLLEWSVVIWWFFDRRMKHPARLAKHSFYGALWSYALDVPALLAVWVTPGAIWVC